MTQEMLQVSNSELIEFRDCRRRWYLSYYRCLSKPESLSGALAIGTNIHSALAAYYSPSGSKGLALGLLNSIYEEAKQNSEIVDTIAIEKDHKLARIMCEGYFEWVEETGADADLEIIEPEAEIEYVTRLGDVPVRIRGKRDVIAIHKSTGISCLIDHKTCQSFNDPALDLNEQSRMYLLLQRLNGGTVVQNCVWNLLRKTQRTARAEPPFYKREELYVSEDELRRFYIRIHGIIRDIIDVRSKLDSGESHQSICYPRPSRDCSWKCPYRTVCPLLDSEGEKAESFLLDQFKVGDPYARYETKGNAE